MPVYNPSSVVGGGVTANGLPQYNASTPANPAQQLRNALGFFQGVYGVNPQTGGTIENQASIGRINSQIGLMPGELQYQTGAAQQGYNLDVARLGVQKEGNQFDQGMVDRELANQLAGIQTQEEQSRFGQMSEATARGAVVTEGNRMALKGIGEVASQGREGANISADKARKQLTLQAKDYGIQEQQLKQALDEGLHNLQLSNTLSTWGLLDKLDSANAQDRMVAQKIMQDVLSNSSLFSSQAPQGPSSAPLKQYKGGGGKVM